MAKGTAFLCGGGGQGSLACCNPWGHVESCMTAADQQQTVSIWKSRQSPTPCLWPIWKQHHLFLRSTVLLGGTDKLYWGNCTNFCTGIILYTLWHLRIYCTVLLLFWSRKWEPTPVFLPGKFRGQRSLVGYSAWGCKESATTEWLNTALLFRYMVYSSHYSVCLLRIPLHYILMHLQWTLFWYTDFSQIHPGLQ